MPWTKLFVNISEFKDEVTGAGLRGLSYREALREVQGQLLEDNDDVVIIGEGVDDPGGIFGSTLGLAEAFGKNRVMDIPIAENGMVGVAIGAAIAGMKPIFVHMRTDFLPMCMDQLVNHAAKWYYMTGGQVNVPLVVRSIIGRGWGSAAQHAQALHGLFMNVPGLKIVMPSTPYDVKGLMVAALQDGNPVMFFEHRWVYDYVGYVPEGLYKVPIGKGVVRREGRDVTVVALSQMVFEAIRAARILEQDGIDVEVVDPRTLKPLDEDMIFESVKKTGRLVIADVACKTGGVGAEIACRVAESAHNDLRCPIKRINFPDAPVPNSPVLENAYYPDKETIIRSVKELFIDG